MVFILCNECLGLNHVYGDDFDNLNHREIEGNIKKIKAQELWFQILEQLKQVLHIYYIRT